MAEFSVNAIMADVRAIVEAEGKQCDATIEEMAEVALEKVKKYSPKKLTDYTGKRRRWGRKAGEYKKSWNVKRTTKAGYKVFEVLNEKHARLTHILEKGTDPRRTKKGANRGKVKKDPHIRKAYDETVAEFTTRILGGK
jgi:hypothetical protein